MSSTNRGAERSASDYYVTKIPDILAFLHAFAEDRPAFASRHILDPCAGGDDRNPMSYPEAIRQAGWNEAQIDTIDIRPDSVAARKGDYLRMDLDVAPDIIISNPPFGLALEFIQKALRNVKRGGLVIMLLRLNFFGSRKRRSWFQANMPLYTYVHAERLGSWPEQPSQAMLDWWASQGKEDQFKSTSTDSIEYTTQSFGLSTHLQCANMPAQ
jgi:hypothetical protein